MADIEVVMDKLQSFETAEDLAEFFRGYGIKAQPRNARSCAISQFVREETGMKGVVTNTGYVMVYTDPNETKYDSTYPHSPAMMDFVEMYDKDFYPDLIEEGYSPYYGVNS